MGAKNTIKRTEKIFFLTFRSAMPVKRLPERSPESLQTGDYTQKMH